MTWHLLMLAMLINLCIIWIEIFIVTVSFSKADQLTEEQIAGKWRTISFLFSTSFI